MWWPKLEDKLKAIGTETECLEAIPVKEEEGRSQSEILEELVELVRSQNNIVNDLKSSLPSARERLWSSYTPHRDPVEYVTSYNYIRSGLRGKLTSMTSRLMKLGAVLKNYGDEPPFDFIKQTTRDLSQIVADIDSAYLRPEARNEPKNFWGDAALLSKKD